MNRLDSLLPAPALAALGSLPPPRGARIDLHLDGNEGMPPPRELFSALTDAGPDAMRLYPEARELESLLASRLGVEPAQVVVTAGADEALDRICRAVLAPGREIVLPVPTFEMLSRYPLLAGASIAEVPWDANRPFPIDAVLAAVNERTAAIAFVTPNNPTGNVASAGDLKRLAVAAPHALLIVDLAYAEFAERDLTEVALLVPNAIVVRTLSKAYGLAGVRVGYAAGPARVVDWVRRCGSPFTVSRPSLALALARLTRDAADVKAHIERIRQERTRLFELVRELGATAYRSEANFVLARDPRADWFAEALARLGIAVRTFPHRKELANSVRITCPGDEPGFARLEHALRTAAAPEALLVACDGELPRRAQLVRLAERLPLALVGDAPEELPDDVRALFSERAPTIPEALRRLNVRRAWCIAATDGVRGAARAAGVVPLDAAEVELRFA